MRVCRVRSGVGGGARWGAGAGGVAARSDTEDGGVDGEGGSGDSVAGDCVGVGEVSVASDGPSVVSGEEDFAQPGISMFCVAVGGGNGSAVSWELLEILCHSAIGDRRCQAQRIHTLFSCKHLIHLAFQNITFAVERIDDTLALSNTLAPHPQASTSLDTQSPRSAAPFSSSSEHPRSKSRAGRSSTIAMAPQPQPSAKALRAAQKRAQQPRNSLPAIDFSIAHRILPWTRAVLYLVAAAAGSYVSQLSLAPVYGEIPSSLHHEKIASGVFFSAWLLKGVVRKFPVKLSALIPVLVLYAPGVLHFVFRYSAKWGAVDGPIYTEALTYYPVLFLSVYAAATLMQFNNIFLDAIPAGISFTIFSIARGTISGLLQNHIGSSWALTRCGLHHVLGGLYALLSPTLLLATTIAAMIHSAGNPMCVLKSELNETLSAYNYTLIARHESNTGYISVLENFQLGYRVLRCDHSLLGGEWQRPPVGFEHMGHPNFKEPIYSIFVIMEAVRLIEPAPKSTSPKALAM